MNDLFLENIPVEHLTREQAVIELKRLASEIRYHDKLYYQEDSPEITDAEYDALRLRNLAIERRFPDLVLANSPSLKVGAPAAQGFKKVVHKKPMLSLDNAFSEEDVYDFYSRIKRFLNLKIDEDIEVIAEPKIDGLSAALTYQDGVFIRGATRGDGDVGTQLNKYCSEISIVFSGSPRPHFVRPLEDECSCEDPAI